MARESGHKFDGIKFNILDSRSPIVGINPTTCHMSISTGAIDALQGKNLTGMSREMRAVLAHEVVGHVGHDARMVKSRLLPIVACPLIAVTAYGLLNEYMNKGKSKEEEVKQISGSEKDQSKHSYMSDTAYTVAKYVAVGALGLAAGGFVARHVSLAAEFAADARAVKFTKDPEALIMGLTKLEEAAKQAINSASKEATGVVDWMRKMVRKFENATIHAHPEHSQRIAHIRGIQL